MKIMGESNRWHRWHKLTELMNEYGGFHRFPMVSYNFGLGFSRSQKPSGYWGAPILLERFSPPFSSIGCRRGRPPKGKMRLMRLQDPGTNTNTFLLPVLDEFRCHICFSYWCVSRREWMGMGWDYYFSSYEMDQQPSFPT